jgi:flagellar protein FliO/FliZ
VQIATHSFRITLLALFSNFVIADDSAVGVPSGTFFQAFLGLAAIVALLLASAYLARKIWGGKGFGRGGMNIIGGVALSPKERIVLIEAGDTWLVVGVVPGQIRTLHSMPKGTLNSDASTTPVPFAHWIKKFSDEK